MKDFNDTYHISFIVENTEITLYYKEQLLIHDLQSSLPHEHPLHEIFILCDGEMLLEGNFKAKRITADSICIIPPHTVHSTITNQSSAGVKSITLFLTYKRINAKSIKFDFYDYISRLSVKNHEPMVFKNSPLIVSNLISTAQGIKNNNFSNLQGIKTVNSLTLLFISLCESFPELDEGKEFFYTKSVDYYIKLINLSTILDIKAFDIDFKEVEKRMYMSIRQIQKIFKSEYGMSITKYNHLIKMERSAFFLRHNPSISISETAAICNYASAEIFSQTFKKYFGISPLKYKQRYLSRGLYNDKND